MDDCGRFRVARSKDRVECVVPPRKARIDHPDVRESLDLDLMVAVAKEAAVAGGAALKAYFGARTCVYQKARGDIVTDADVASESAIVRVLLNEFPCYCIISEELGTIGECCEVSWLVDPLDGTSNFAAGVPQVSVVIAVLQQQNVVAGVVHQPFTNVTWDAIEGKGARRDGCALKARVNSASANGLVAYMRGYQVGIDQELRAQKALKGCARRVMSNWSPALDWCLLAEGRIDGVISESSGAESQWAGILIAREAGAIITDSDGGEVNWTGDELIIGGRNHKCHHDLMNISESIAPIS